MELGMTEIILIFLGCVANRCVLFYANVKL